MAQIIVPPIRFSPFKQKDFAGDIGTGIASGIQALLEYKTNQMKKRQTQTGLEALGYSPEKAQALSAIDPNILRDIVRSGVSSRASGGAAARPQMDADQLKSLLPHLGDQQIQALLAEPSLINEYVKQSIREPGQRQFASRLAEVSGKPDPYQQTGAQEQLQQGAGVPGQQYQGQQLQQGEQPFIDSGFPEENIYDSGFEQDDRIRQQETLPGFNEEVPREEQRQAGAIENKDYLLNEHQLLEIHKAEQEQKKLQAKVESENKKIASIKSVELKKDFEKNVKERDRNKRLIDVLARQDELNKEGLGSSAWNYTMGKLGYTWMMNPNAEEYAANQKEFLRDLQSIFGGRVGIDQMKEFMKSIPTLSNTTEGRDRINKALTLLYKGKYIKNKVTLDTIKKYKNREDLDPLDISIKAEKRYKEKKRALAEKINNTVRGEKTALPDASKFTENEPFINPETGEMFIKRNGKVSIYTENQ